MSDLRNREWYRRNLAYSEPDTQWIDDVDPRCWQVLAAMPTGIHNLVDQQLPGHGIRPLGRRVDPDVPPTRLIGIELLLRRELATVDMDELTRLCLAAHQHLVRVSVDSADLRTYLRNPFDFESGYAEVLDPGEEEPWEPANWAGCQATTTRTRWRWARTGTPSDGYTDYHVGCVPDGQYGMWSLDPHMALTCKACGKSIEPTVVEERCELQLHRDGPNEEWVHYVEPGDTAPAYDHEPDRTSIDVQPINGLIQIMLHPRIERIPGKTSNMEHHPTLDHLVERIHQMQGRRRTTRTQKLMKGSRRG